MNKLTENKSTYSVFLLIFLAMIWGSSFVLIKKSLLAFDYLQVAALRVGITMLWFLPFVFSQFKKVKNKRTYWFLLIMGLFGNAIPAFLFPLAQTQIDSSLAGILNSCTPIFVMIMGALFFNTTPSRNKIIGVLFGLLGAGLLILYGQSGLSNGNSWYAIFALLAAICYAISTNVIKEYLQDLPAITTTSLAFFFVGPIAWIYLFSSDFIHVMQTDENAWFSFMSVAALATFGTALATLLFVKLIQMTSAVWGAMVTYLIPIVAIFFGFLDGELITLWHAIGITLILFGVYLAKGK
jgi:drug/metabolite transporter (DMT)-like permease